MSRYNRRSQAINSAEEYKKTFHDRGVTKITQYVTETKKVYEQEVYDSVEVIYHTWKYGDMYWRLSSRFYGDPQYWWVIASFNKKPTESFNNPGDVIKIPTNLSDALQVIQ